MNIHASYVRNIVCILQITNMVTVRYFEVMSNKYIGMGICTTGNNTMNYSLII
jgi:predicted RNA-binding protein with RPS1 domain